MGVNGGVMNVRRLFGFCYSVLIVLLAFFCAISLWSYGSQDHSLFYDSTEFNEIYTNYAGSYGAQVAAFLLYFCGCSAFFLVPAFLILARIVYDPGSNGSNVSRFSALLLCIPIAGGLGYSYTMELFSGVSPGGILGRYTYWAMLWCFEPLYALAFLHIVLWALLIIIIRFSFVRLLYPLGSGIKQTQSIQTLSRIIQLVFKFFVVLKRFAERLPKGKKVQQFSISDDPFWQQYCLKRDPSSE